MTSEKLKFIFEQFEHNGDFYSLTDFFNGNIYYKTKYPEHNLDRAKNQFKLLQSLSEKLVI